VAAATVGCLLPFVGKALHVDDHRYVQMAQQIRADPLDYFGFSVNLGGSQQPEAAVSHNPPGVAFYAAAAAWLTGWSEVGLHLAFLLPALAATLGTFALARRLGGEPLLAGLFCLACPVFLVSATTVMADVSMTALFGASIWCWLRGLDERRGAWLLAGAALATLCALTKYFGIALLPLLAAYTLLRERRIGVWAWTLLLPVAALWGYELYTAETYGVSPILRAAGYSVTTRTGGTGGLERALIAVVFVGGALVSLLFFLPIAFSRRMGLASLGLGSGVLALCLVHGRLAGVPLTAADPNLVAHVAVFAIAGVAIFVLVAADLARERSPEAALLALWVLGAFAFGTVVNYTTNGRSLLSMTPPVAILLARQVAAREGTAPGARRFAALVPGIALALAVAWGDAALANASREAARRIAVATADLPGTVWFDGAWGFQHYMTKAGARAVDVRQHVLRPGDHLASSTNWKLRLAVSPQAATLVERFALPLPPVTTMLAESATGFYAIQWGPLPFRILPGMSEHFELRRLAQRVIFEPDPDEIERRGREVARAARALAPLLALAAADWPTPRDADPSAADAWRACTPVFERLAGAVRARCLWCASEVQCAQCLGSEAERSRLDPACGARLEAAMRALPAACRARPDEAVCREQQVQRQVLAGERAPR
jgi:4-amino-4-deoxy-L-arabinose transferase-like glycosyltransferase